MKTKSFTKRLIICIVALISSIFAMFGFANSRKDVPVDAATSNTISIPNNNFTFTNGSKMPYGVSNFTASQTMQTADGENINGIIDLSKDGDYKNFKNAYANYGFSDNDAKVLMINNKFNDSYFGYTTANTISLAADSHFVITVNVFTENEAGIAYVSLYDENGRVLGSVEHISGKWDTVSMFVSTNEFQSKSVKIGLFAKGKGVAMFDNLDARSLDKDTLNSRIDASKRSGTPYCYVNLANLVVKEDYLSGSNDIFTKLYNENDDKETTRHAYLNANEDIQIKNGNKPSALLIENLKSSYVSFVTNNNYLKFEQNNVYSVTIAVKTFNLSGSASLKLVEANKNLQGTDSNEITISSNTSGFENYTFYVRGSSLEDKNYEILVSLGSASSTASGRLYISNINVAKVNYSTYNSGSNKLDLAVDEAANSSTYFTNGNFNQLEVSDVNNPLPAGATGWTVTTGTNRQVYGVINTSSSAFAKMVEGNEIALQNPGSKNGSSNNNMLMLFNTTADTLAYTSPTINITKGEYKKFSLDLRTVQATTTVSVVYKKDDAETVLSTKTLNPTTSWADGTTEFYIYCPYQDLEVSIRIKIETSAWGACFVDDVRYFASTQTEFESQQDAIDLSNLFASNSNKDFAEPTFFTITGAKADVGIINSQSNDVLNEKAQISILKDLPNKDKNSNVLAISAEENSYVTITSKIGFGLTSGDGEYYKISVSFYAPELTNENEKTEFGVGIALTSFEENFKNLKSADGWSTYTFYISADSATTTNIVLSLGEESSTCAGKVFFGNINFEKLSDIASVEDFETLAKEDKHGLLLNKVVNDEEQEETTKKKDDKNSINWWYIVPSAIFAVAIIVCVVGVMARKVKWKKPGKKVKNAYDRNKTVSVQYYTRKATQERETKVRELQKELDNLTKQRSTYEEEYKHDMSTMRELKIKRASASEISKLEKDMKKNRKLASAIGLNIKRVENEIDYVKSPAYLNALIRKMSNERQMVDEQLDTDANTEDAAEKTETK